MRSVTKFCQAVALCLLAAAGCSRQSSLPAGTPTATSASPSGPRLETFEFENPVRLATASGAIRVESPGFASPCWADVDDDGAKDLLVGQFANGQIRIYSQQGDLQFDEGRWLEANGKMAIVPGVW